MSLDNIPNSLLIKIKATHFNWLGNKNSVLYSTNAVDTGAASWVKPYNKPQLVAHDTKSDPVGRVVDYKIIKGGDNKKKPDNYIELTVRISDKNSIEKIIDGRYYTVSVGSRSSKVSCSECNQSLTEDGLCEHKKGTVNEKGKLIYWIIDEIEYTEDSFVNEPADEYAVIDQIYAGGEWVDFKKFLDSRENKMEAIMENTDAKLSTEQRTKLPGTAFCGPNRSFPAHDKAHVTAGLRLLNKAKVSDSVKAKIKACLYRKGKKYGIAANKDEVGEDFDILYRLEDEFTPEEITEIDAWFKENPDSDLPDVAPNTDTAAKTEQTDSNDTTVEKDLSKLKKDELLEELNKTQKQLKDTVDGHVKALELRDKTIEELTGKVKNTETLINEKEDELNKYVDKLCVLEKKYRNAIISNIIDLKLTDNNIEERTKLNGVLEKRASDSLEDSLQDLRTEKFEKPIQSQERVDDPTKQTENTDSVTPPAPKKEEDVIDPKFKIFSIDRRNTTEVD